MKDPLQVFYPPRLGKCWVLRSLCQLLDFNKRLSECLGIRPQFTITLGGKISLNDMLVVLGPLEFNMLLGCGYVNAMNVLVSMLFCVMHFPHTKSIVTIYQL
jgi:hypothetical protein